MPYYNTTHLTGQQLAKEIAMAESQEQTILLFFRCYKKLSPSQCYNRLHLDFGINWPLTSIRRAITDLTKMELLEKTNTMREGIYSKEEHCWRLLAPGEQLSMDL